MNCEHNYKIKRVIH